MPGPKRIGEIVETDGTVRMTYWTKMESLSVVVNCGVEFIHLSKPFIAGLKRIGETVKTTGAVRMTCWTKTKSLSVMVNCRVEVTHLSKPVIAGLKSIGKVVEVGRVEGMAFRAT
jgi:hypothetical protein